MSSVHFPSFPHLSIAKPSSIGRSSLAHFVAPHGSFPQTTSIAHGNRLFNGRAFGVRVRSSNTGVSKMTSSNNGPAPSDGPTPKFINMFLKSGWVLGSIFFMAVPFYKKLIKIEGRVEKAVETAVEVAEKAAKTAEDVCDKVVDGMPENSTLKQEVLEVKRIAQVLEKDAEIVEGIIQKVDHLKDEMEEIINKEEQKERENKDK